MKGAGQMSDGVDDVHVSSARTRDDSALLYSINSVDAAGLGTVGRLRLVWRYRELLVNLTRKELKVRYKNSILGFLWSLLNPLLYLVVFSVVFQEILRAQIPRYAIFLLSGLVVWNLFSSGLAGGTASIVGNAALVQKVWFPREVLPLASVGAALVHFFLQLAVLAVALAAFRHPPDAAFLLVLIPALMVLVVLLSGLAIGLSALNVRLRDIQHLLELALLAWFWFTPIVYEYLPVQERLGSNAWVAHLNPVLSVVLVFQRALYNPSPGVVLPEQGVSWYLGHLGVSAVVAIAVLFVGMRVFGRIEADLAEEI